MFKTYSKLIKPIKQTKSLQRSIAMSIYSGFATRQQEETYDHCINSLLYILQKRILKFYTNQKTDEYKFSSLVQKMYLQMKQMEKSKYLDPKCSYAIQELFEYLMKENQTDRNATVQNDSHPEQQNLRNQVQRKNPIEQKSLDGSNVNEPYGKQKTYQIPIRTEKSSPDAKRTRNSNSGLQNVGKIVSSKSKQKTYPVTIEHGTSMLRKRTPSTSQGSRLIQKVIPQKQGDFSLHHPRKTSFTQEGIKYKPFSKSTARIQLDTDDLLKQHELHEIIQGYIEKSKRSRISSQNNSRSKLNRSIQQQEGQYFSKR